MSKLILLGIVLFTSVVPIALSSRRNSRKTVRLIQILTVVATFIWAYCCRRYYPELVTVD